MLSKTRTYILNHLSWIALLFLILFMVSSYNLWRNWLGPNRTPFIYDVNNYYSYLPALFIHHDLGFGFPNDYWLIQSEATGKLVMKGSIGMAILYAPGFLIGHWIAGITGEVQNGYTWPYAWSVYYGTILYMIFGLAALRKSLRLYFSEGVTGAVLITLYLGTNLLYYNLSSGEMPHGYLFALYCFWIHAALSWIKQDRISGLYWVAFISGLILVARSVEVFTLLILPLIGIMQQGWKERWLKVILNPKHVFMCALLLAIPIIPQLVYWKVYAGSWIFYAYPGEHFFFDHPKIADFLWSYRKGWFIYTPLMLSAMAGLFFLKKRASEWFPAVPIILVILVFVLSSWWTWWYGGGFGMRALIQYYAFLAFAIGSLYTQIAWRKWLAYVVVTCLIVLNLFQTYQYKIAYIHWDSMTKESYWFIFGRLRVTAEESDRYETLLDHPDYEAARKGDR